MYLTSNPGAFILRGSSQRSQIFTFFRLSYLPEAFHSTVLEYISDKTGWSLV